MPQVRDSLTRSVNSGILDSRAIIRTRPLDTPIISANVPGLSDRDMESLGAEAGLAFDQPHHREWDRLRAARPMPHDLPIVWEVRPTSTDRGSRMRLVVTLAPCWLSVWVWRP